MTPLRAGVVALLVHLVSTYKLPDGIGKVPAMGWSSWNAFGCDIDAQKIQTAADLLVSKGFKSAGYEYVNIDDCWGNKTGRDPITGRLQANATLFHGGISAVAKHTHSLGLKQGIYSSAGLETCQGYPASLGHEALDAATFASWGIDYLKYDNCNAPPRWYDTCYACDQDDYYNPNLVNGSCTDTNGLCPSGYDYAKCKTAERYRRMANALHAVNRTILYSLCEWGINEPWTWGGSMAQSWRTTNDVSVNFTRILNFVNLNTFWQNYNGFYGHNDMDLLEVGNGLTIQESRSQFALWALMKSPLIMSTDLSRLNDAEATILQNEYLIRFNQDQSVAAPAIPYKWGLNLDWTFNATSPAEYWAGDSSDGTMVALFNTQDRNKTMQLEWSEIPGLGNATTFNVVDVWTGENQGCIKDGLQREVEGHDVAAFLVEDKCAV